MKDLRERNSHVESFRLHRVYVTFVLRVQLGPALTGKQEILRHADRIQNPDFIQAILNI